MTSSRCHRVVSMFAAALLVLSWGTGLRVRAGDELSSDDLDAGWICLFDGEAVTDADWHVADGEIRVSGGTPGLLRTTTQFGDFELRFEFRADAETNSGVFLRTPPVPTDPTKDCYELNIAAKGVSPFTTGSLVGRAKAPVLPTSDDWQPLRVVAEGGRFRVYQGDDQLVDYTDPAPLGRGYIGLQLNSGPVAFRNIHLRPLGMRPLFNGENLDGWRVAPDHESVFTVEEGGILRVTDGNGQLETEATFDDFALQLQIKTNGRALNSGIFFRSIPGEFWQGYESQIQNAFLNDDRTQPADFGTGGFYRRQPARKVVADDFTWFHKTLVADDRHMAVWVNGYQVSDFTDTRPADENPRRGLRREAGTISLQGHDPTTDIEFRDLRIGPIPPRRLQD